jgi:hypothetical protein
MKYNLFVEFFRCFLYLCILFLYAAEEAAPSLVVLPAAAAWRFLANPRFHSPGEVLYNETRMWMWKRVEGWRLNDETIDCDPWRR